jgi:SHS2 domain-containing protein
MTYKFLDHTSDIGVEVRSSDFKGALVEAICGLIEIIFGKSFVDFDCEANFETLEVSSFDKESLIVDTLNEILYLIDTRKIIPVKPEILDLSNNKVILRYKPFHFNFDDYPIHLYVKAVTFHQLEIIENENETIIKYFVDI